MVSFADAHYRLTQQTSVSPQCERGSCFSQVSSNEPSSLDEDLNFSCNASSDCPKRVCLIDGLPHGPSKNGPRGPRGPRAPLTAVSV